MEVYLPWIESLLRVYLLALLSPCGYYVFIESSRARRKRSLMDGRNAEPRTKSQKGGGTPCERELNY